MSYPDGDAASVQRWALLELIQRSGQSGLLIGLANRKGRPTPYPHVD